METVSITLAMTQISASEIYQEYFQKLRHALPNGILSNSHHNATTGIDVNRHQLIQKLNIVNTSTFCIKTSVSIMWSLATNITWMGTASLLVSLIVQNGCLADEAGRGRRLGQLSKMAYVIA